MVPLILCCVRPLWSKAIQRTVSKPVLSRDNQKILPFHSGRSRDYDGKLLYDMPPKPAISTQLHPSENLQRTSHTRPPSPDSPQCSPRKSFSELVAQPSASISPSIRYPLTRPLSPDLPTRDALYLFCNFSSYMRSPHEGPEGVKSSEDFRDTIRLLDFARVSVYSEVTKQSDYSRWRVHPIAMCISCI